MKKTASNEKVLKKVFEIIGNCYKKNKILTVIVVAVLAVAIIAGVLLFGGSDNSQSGDSSSKATTTTTTSTSVTTTITTTTSSDEVEIVYNFRYENYLEEHFEKHKEDTGCESIEEYLERANVVISHPDSLVGEEKAEGDDEGGDTVYYLEETNEIVFLSSDGYIRTYFKPARGKEYFEDNTNQLTIDN